MGLVVEGLDEAVANRFDGRNRRSARNKRSAGSESVAGSIGYSSSMWTLGRSELVSDAESSKNS